MKKTLLAITSAILLAGAASTATAQDRYYDSYYDSYYDRDVIYVDGDYDRDGIPNSYDRNDYRNDRYSYDRYGNRVLRDRDCDGVPNRYDRNSRRNARDRDCDGIPNRFDRIDDGVYSARTRYFAPRYVEPRGYRYSRWDVGSYLPVGYYGSPYYVDYRPYGLAPPPYGYRWNRVGNDVYLVSTRSGLIAEIVYSLFR